MAERPEHHAAAAALLLTLVALWPIEQATLTCGLALLAASAATYSLPRARVALRHR